MITKYAAKIHFIHVNIIFFFGLKSTNLGHTAEIGVRPVGARPVDVVNHIPSMALSILFSGTPIILVDFFLNVTAYDSYVVIGNTWPFCFGR